MSELKPCPFCGATAAVEKIGRDWWRLKALHDDECALDSDHMLQAPHTPEGRAWVIAAWNRRAPASEGEQK
ncbi:Lar family restriction alleviation protein [Burkholderia cenocepacia]|nr:Lar family restriction alleviation protein [Burkholderia cenocepacia]